MPHICLKCNGNFRTKQHLDRHLDKVRPCDQKNNTCPHCKITLSNKKNYTYHIDHSVCIRKPEQIIDNEIANLDISRSQDIDLEKEKIMLEREKISLSRMELLVELKKQLLKNNTITTENVRKTSGVQKSDKQNYIYLVQSPNFIGTNIFKIGTSAETKFDHSDLSRIKSYGPNTRIVGIYRTTVGQVIEAIIIRIFRQKFELVKGKEWFKGDSNVMTDIITKVIDFYENIDNSNENSSSCQDHRENQLQRSIDCGAHCSLVK